MGSRKIVDLTNKEIGLLTVVWFDYFKYFKNNSRIAYWKCKCECGCIKSIASNNLTSGRVVSCGCYSRKRASEVHKKYEKGSNSRLYHIWQDIKQRCYNPNEKKFSDYGERGISVCDEWKNDYENFCNWAYKNGYDENALFGKCSIDRINVNGNYEPNNCRWVDFKTQGRNKRNNRIIEYDKERYTASEFCEKFNLNYKTFMNRIYSNWSLDKILEKSNILLK